jgi:ketosteroid isomerase-like protein
MIPMKRVLLLGLATLVSSFFAVAQEKQAPPSANGEVVKQIKKMEEDRNQAVLRGDAAALDRVTSDDYTFITLRGELRTKSEILKGFKSGSFKYESRDLSDLNVRVYGNTAVVTGRATQKGVEDGKDYSGDYRFTRVYIRQRDHWFTVALQVTRVAPQ